MKIHLPHIIILKVKHILLLIIFLTINLFSTNISLKAQTPEEAPNANQTVLYLSRALSKDLFELNGVPFMQPLVEAINSTSNARFVNTAYIPKEVEKAYIKVSLNGMFGLVNNSMQSYKPNLPLEQFDGGKLLNYIQIDEINGQPGIKSLDTARLFHYLLKTILFDAVNSKDLVVPTEAATILGRSNQNINFTKPDGTSALLPATYRRIDSINNALTAIGLPPLSDSLTNNITNVFSLLPSYFTLPPGGDYSSIFAGVPQIEIGSLYGTELLIRFIPPIKMSEEIGKFSFYGFGLKHSISQYFDDPEFDMAVQGVYQTTELTNQVGVTNAELKANATMLNFNLQASKRFEDWFDVYTGFSYDQIEIDTRFTYFLAKEIQGQVGLLKPIKDSEGNNIDFIVADGFPGDTSPQVASLLLNSNNFKWTIGMRKEIGDFAVFADYNVANFNIFSFGVQYTINNPFIEKKYEVR
jgi:hypothetical protein